MLACFVLDVVICDVLPEVILLCRDVICVVLPEVTLLYRHVNECACINTTVSEHIHTVHCLYMHITAAWKERKRAYGPSWSMALALAGMGMGNSCCAIPYTLGQ